ncbi:MAG: hypothetical protein E5X33_12090 [Mesorhizobium sp.]|uniref:hypothetical protein n=1 Tax=unclassified Mesorhizobium TaxID=325217 RepID=UPI00121C4067|nr:MULTISPECIES: hypothetical protein [unclassified Mesorhizobium]MDG4908133.1 hypothetical protein [Mesorhizobium sp. WSM4898]TIR21798.1 MAG: hypothetical protein E5X33_12090 [Mesorhizobium sp.]
MKQDLEDLAKLRAALVTEVDKLGHLTAQAEAWVAATAEERKQIVADVERRGQLKTLLLGLEAAREFHERSEAMFRDVINQIGQI